MKKNTSLYNPHLLINLLQWAIKSAFDQKNDNYIIVNNIYQCKLKKMFIDMNHRAYFLLFLVRIYC